MTTPQPARPHLSLSDAVSAAARDAVSRHALQHGPPYSMQQQQQQQQQQQPFLIPGSRTSGGGQPPGAPPPPPSAAPTESAFSGSPWTPPPRESDEVLDLSLGKPPSMATDTGRNEGTAGDTAGGSDAGMATDSDADDVGEEDEEEQEDAEGEEDERAEEAAEDGEADSELREGAEWGAVAVQEAVKEGGTGEGNCGDGDLEGGPDSDDAEAEVEAASSTCTARDPTADGLDDEGPEGVRRQIAAAPITGVSDAAASCADAGADTVRGMRAGDTTGGAAASISHGPPSEPGGVAVPLGASAVPAMVTPPPSPPPPPPPAAPVSRGPAHAPAPPPGAGRPTAAGKLGGGSSRVSSIGGGLTGISGSSLRINAVGPTSGAPPPPLPGATGSSTTASGAAAGSGGSPGPATRLPRPSWAGSHDSSPPSTSGSVRGAPSPGPGNAAAAAGRRPPFAPASDLAALGASMTTPLTASGSVHQLTAQSSASSVGRTAAAKIHIAVSANTQGLGLNVEGRGGGTATVDAAGPRYSQAVRRGRPTAAAGAGVPPGPQPRAAAAAPPPAALPAASDGPSLLQQSSELWSSARRLRVSLHRLHQQYQTYHAQLQRAGEADLEQLQQQPLAVLQPQQSRRAGHPPPAGPRSEASGTTSVSTKKGRGNAAGSRSAGSGAAAAAAAGSSSGGAGGGGGGGGDRTSPPRQPRRAAPRRPHSAPQVRQPVGRLPSTGLRVELDTQLQLGLAAEASHGSLPAVQSVMSLADLDRAWEGRWSQLLHPDVRGGGGAPPRALRAAKSLPAKSRGGPSHSPRSPRAQRAVRDVVSGTAAEAELAPSMSSPRSPGRRPPASLTSPRAAAAAAAAAAAGWDAPASPPPPRPGRRRASPPPTHPLLLVASLATTSSLSEDPDLAEVIENAQRRAAVEKEKMRAARKVAAGGGGGGGGGSGRVSERRRAGGAAEPPPAAAAAAEGPASEKTKGFELLFQRQAEQWARTHRQMPPRRRLAPAVTKMVEKWFSLVDNDGSGLLETRELTHALQAAGVPCSEDDLLELVSTIDVNRDGAVSLSEFLAFLLKELGAGKNLTTGEYELPSGGQLPFAAMIARLKRLRVLDDVMRGGKARNRYVELLYNRGALAAEIGLSDQVAAGLQAIPLPADGAPGDNDANGAPRRGGRVRLQQLFQQYRQAQRRATTEGLISPQPSTAAAAAAGASQPPRLDDDDDEVDSLLGGRGGDSTAPLPRPPGARRSDLGRMSPDPAAPAPGGGGAAAAAAAAGGMRGGGGGLEGDSDMDAVTAGFGERVSGVSYYPRYSPEVSMLQGACLSQRASGDNLVVIPGGPAVGGPAASGAGPEGVDPSLLFQLTEVLLPLEESNISGLEGEGEGGGGDDGDESPSAFATGAAAAAAVAAAEAPPSPARFLLPVISPLPPIKRPTTRAFQRALLDVRHSAPEYLLQRMGFVGPREAAAAAAAAAGSMSPRRGGGRGIGGGSVGGGGGGAAAAAAVHTSVPFRPMASTDPAGLPLGIELSTSSVSTSTSSTSASASDPLTASAAAATKAAAAATGAYRTMYGAGFSRYKRWSMYDIDPATENPDYWQAKAAALLMRRTSRAVKGVPGAGVAALSAATAAAAAAAAAADAARDIDLCRAPSMPGPQATSAPPPAAAAAATAAAAAAAAAPESATAHDSPIAPSVGPAVRPSLPSPSSHRQQPQQHSSLHPEGTASVAWHLPSLQSGTPGASVGGGGGRGVGGGGATAAAASSVALTASLGRSGPSSVASGALSPRRRGAAGDEPWSPGSTGRLGRGAGTHPRGLGAAALLRGSAAAGFLVPPGAPGGGGAGGGGPGSGAPGSPMQYVLRPPHGANPRAAAEALRNRRTAPPPELEGLLRMQRALSKAAAAASRSASRSPARSMRHSPSRSPSGPVQRSATMSPQRVPSGSGEAPDSPQLQLRSPLQRRPASLPTPGGAAAAAP